MQPFRGDPDFYECIQPRGNRTGTSHRLGHLAERHGDLWTLHQQFFSATGVVESAIDLRYLLLLAGDTEYNPGPTQQQQQYRHRWSCGKYSERRDSVEISH